MVRLFIAIDMPEEVLAQAEEIKPQIKIDGKVNWVEKQNQHLTLKFLGECRELQIEEIKLKLSQIKFKQIEAETSSVGVFPSESYIEVIWIGFKDKNKITELKDQIEKALLDDFPKEDRFKVHLTIGRVKFIRNKKEFVESLKTIKINPIPFEVNSFKLYKSTLTPEGPVYEELAVFPAK